MIITEMFLNLLTSHFFLILLFTYVHLQFSLFTIYMYHYGLLYCTYFNKKEVLLCPLTDYLVGWIGPTMRI
jgi:hypothetical protein